MIYYFCLSASGVIINNKVTTTTQAPIANNPNGGCNPNPCTAPQSVCQVYPKGHLCGCPAGKYGFNCNEEANKLSPTVGNTVTAPSYSSTTQEVRFIVNVPSEGAMFTVNQSPSTVVIGRGVFPNRKYNDALYNIVPGGSNRVYIMGSASMVPYYVTVYLNSVPNFLGTRSIGTVTGGGK